MAEMPAKQRAILLRTIPEPSALVLLGVGAFGLFGYAWRRPHGPVLPLHLAASTITKRTRGGQRHQFRKGEAGSFRDDRCVVQGSLV